MMVSWLYLISQSGQAALLPGFRRVSHTFQHVFFFSAGRASKVFIIQTSDSDICSANIVTEILKILQGVEKTLNCVML